MKVKLAQRARLHRERLSSGRPARSLLRQRNKLNVPRLVSHLTQHAVGGSVLFRDDNDYLRMLALIKETAGLFSIRVLAFCLMPDHLHLFLRQEEANLSGAMRRLFRDYSVFFNHKYSRRGHLFRGRFRQSACFDEYYLLSASIYIHLNPVRAGLAPGYRSYRWSSWALYDQVRPPASFVNSGFILNTLASSRAEAVRIYRGLLDEASGEKARSGRSLALRLMLSPDGLGTPLIQTEALSENPLNASEIRSHLPLRKRGSTPNDRRAAARAVRDMLSRGYRYGEIAEELGVAIATVRNWAEET